jgi:hypothetical protein
MSAANILCKSSARLPQFMAFCIILAHVSLANAQAQSPSPQTAVETSSALPDGTAPAASGNGGEHDSAAAGAKPTPELSPSTAEIAKELAEMKARIAQLEAMLNARNGTAAAKATDVTIPTAKSTDAIPVATEAEGVSPIPSMAAPAMVAPKSATAVAQTEPSNSASTAKKKIAPFSDWDWTWLNGNPRNKDVAFDTPFFTPEIRADVTYTYDFNRPQDDSISGSSEIFRSNEIQLEQLGVGGDFHYDNVRARLMTQFGMYSTTTPRNDPSPAKGQWDLSDAYRYLAEAYGGYHINALDGINIDAGIFMSYIGLFSYYNFDNWAYQPSYVSSNTPWFFNGLRVQIFVNPHLKIEPWFINGWQSYGSANSRKGIGGQVKWTPYPWMNIVSNNYGLGHDDLYVPNRGRIHTDDSVEVKYYDRPELTLDKMAFTFTGDMGCEFGPSETTSSGVYVQGVGCHGNRRDAKSTGGDYFGPGVDPKQSFIGFMLYNRMWFKKDRFALTVGGGKINNPGRYLVLVPPINGETAASSAINSPYFSGNPSDPFKAWDSSLTFDYMPRQWLTFRWEYDYRHANVPYWSGAGGITPAPGSNNGLPQYYACTSGASSMQETLAAAEVACGSPGSTSNVWFPDLRRDEQFVDLDILVKF